MILSFIMILSLLLGTPSRAESVAVSTVSPSLYDLKINLEDETGSKVLLSQWKGRSLIVTMTYTSCRIACPLMVKKLKEVEKDLALRPKAIEFIVVTMDPEIDSSQKLTEYYRNAFQIESKHWHFLRGDDKSTLELATALGIHYENSNGHILHDNKFLVLDENGVVQKTIEGWDWKTSDFFPGEASKGPAKRNEKKRTEIKKGS